MAVGSTILNQDAKPKYLSLGGSQANDLYSKSEVAEVFLYNRVLNESEISSLESYLRVKWMGGSLENFPLLVRLNDLQSFASNDGGDLRFYDGQHKPLPFAIDEWNSSGESIIWVQVDDFSADTDIFAYWGNEDNTTLPVHDIWSDYSGVWHLSSARDDTSSGNDASSVGSADLNVSALIGNGLRLSSSGHLSATGYKGILDGDARTVSLWMRSVDSSGPLLSWGAPSNYWEISWDTQGPKVITGAGGVRQGSGQLISGDWHHLLVTYPGNSADMNQTRIFWDGQLVDVPASSSDGTVATVSGIDLRIGSSHDGMTHMSGDLDEVRVATMPRGSAWAAYEYENQRAGGRLLSYDLEYQTAPVLPADLNLTIVRGQAFTYLIESFPPAFEYNISSGTLPSGVTLNSATGLLEGNTTEVVGTIVITLTASNAKGSATTNLHIDIQETIGLPQISAGPVVEVFGTQDHKITNVRLYADFRIHTQPMLNLLT